MEVIVDVEGYVVEEFFVLRIFLFVFGNGVVGLEGFLEVFGSVVDFFGEFFVGDFFYEIMVRVVVSVEVKDFGGFGVEDKVDGVFVFVFFFVDYVRDVVMVVEFVVEVVIIIVEKDIIFIMESFSS